MLLDDSGVEGFIATKTISEGDTRAAFLSRVLEQSARLLWVRPLVWWAGAAQVVVSAFVLSKQESKAKPLLNDIESGEIDATFSSIENSEGEPCQLVRSARLVGKGVGLGGNSFRVSGSEGDALRATDPRHMRRFITGVNHNASLDRWGGEHVFWFEDCETVEDLLKTVTGRAFQHRIEADDRKGRYWRFRRGAGKLYSLLETTRYCIARTQTSSTWWFSFWPKEDVLDQTMIAFGANCPGLYCVLWSSLHESWVGKYGRP